MKKNVSDLILECAESIKKKNMTSFHLLYGYACIALMDDAELCQRLGAGEEDYVRLSYFKNKLLQSFDKWKMAADPKKLRLLIPQYVDVLEQLVKGMDDYHKIARFIDEWQEEDDLAMEFVMAGLLDRLLNCFESDNIQTSYFLDNKSFSIREKADAPGAPEELDIGAFVREADGLYQTLSEKIFGQELAVQKFVQGYMNEAMGGRAGKNRPLATFLFAGPPGVGKTYLAKLAAEQLHMPAKVFDMSEYAGDDLSGLVGFEKTYKDSQPGFLTGFAAEHPRSLIVFDEIEKASRKVQLLFLQVLEGGRLHDKFYDEDVNFEQTIIIFTTNSGKNLYEYNEDADLSALSDGEILDSLREDEEFPKELCSRFASGSMVMFNHLPPHQMIKIVENKMNGAIAEIKKTNGVTVDYDSLLPELFLFHLGSDADARVVSSKSAQWLKEMVMNFAREEVGKTGRFDTKRLSIRVRLDEKNPDVYKLFVDRQVREVLVVSDRPQFEFRNPRIHTIIVWDTDEFMACIRKKNISLILIDLEYKPAENCVRAANALGIESVGKACLDLAKEQAPRLPVYILEKKFYRPEDKKMLRNYGAKGMFRDVSEKRVCLGQIRKILGQLYVQENLSALQKKGMMLDFKARYVLEETRGVTELYGMSLKSMVADNSRLRKTARKFRIYDFDRPKLRFGDIIGANQAKQELNHFIRYIKNTEQYVREGAERPKGVILYGPPGTGKTSLAKAFAGECGATFLNTTGADIRNAKNPVQEIKDLFQIAYSKAPTILFIDEIDVIAKERTGHDTGTELLINTLLTEMEGFQDRDPFKPVFVVAATNYNVERGMGRPSEVVLDAALVRRFDNPVYVGLPGRNERRQYLLKLLEEKHCSEKISEAAVDYAAEHTGGRSLAFLKRTVSNMINLSIDMKREIHDDLLTDVLETQLYGEKRENNDEYRLRAARHEAGHAYAAWMTKKTPKFITIVSRGNFGGYVSFGDGEDVRSETKEDCLDDICFMLAGQAAEVVYYGQQGINTGARSDLQMATQKAIQMICSLGMGNLGLVSANPETILGTAKGAEVLEEASRILEEQRKRAEAYIREGKPVIERVVDVLMDKSYIQGENLLSILEEGEQAVLASAGSGKKKQKWYVVFAGRKTGIYGSWQECADQIHGYRNASYCSYPTREMAEQAFRDSRIGVKNVRDKKLLYHLVKLSEMEDVFENGLRPDVMYGQNTYTGFDFCANTPEARRIQRAQGQEGYAYICITRETASEMGCKILIEDARQEDSALYDYEDGMQKADWKLLEQAGTDESISYRVRCLCQKILSHDEIRYIYVADEEAAEEVRRLYQNVAGQEGRKVSVNVNRRMFLPV